MRLSFIASLSLLISMATANGALRSSVKNSEGDQTTPALRELHTVVFYTKECLDAKPAPTLYFGVDVDVAFTGPDTCSIDDERAFGVRLEGLMADFSVEAKLVQQHAFAVIMCPKPGQQIDDDFFSDLTPKLLPPPGAREPDPTNKRNAIVPGIQVPEPPSFVVVGESTPGANGEDHGAHGQGVLNDKTKATVALDEVGANRALARRWVWSWRGGGASKRCVASNDTAIATPYADALAGMRLEMAGRIEEFLATSTMDCLVGDAAEVFVTMTPVETIKETHLGCARRNPK
jgi:hypothetical protein